MFDHEGVKTIKRFQVFQSSFHMSNLKNWSPKKWEDKGPNMHNPKQFMAFQNLLYNFQNEFLMWFFSLRFSIFEESQDCNRHPCTTS